MQITSHTISLMKCSDGACLAYGILTCTYRKGTLRNEKRHEKSHVLYTHNTHFKWERGIRTLDVFVKNTKKCHLTLAKVDVPLGNIVFFGMKYMKHRMIW